MLHPEDLRRPVVLASLVVLHQPALMHQADLQRPAGQVLILVDQVLPPIQRLMATCTPAVQVLPPAVLLLPVALEVLVLLVICLQRLRHSFQQGISVNFDPIKLLA